MPPARFRSEVIALLALFSLTSTLPMNSHADEPSPKLKTKEFTSEVTVKVGYRYALYTPDEYAAHPKKYWPLIVFLHGSGERGEDVNVLTRHGPPKLVAGGKSFPAFIASPQAPEHNVWEPHSVKALVDALVREYRIDEDRIYITGMSMGGYGVWDAIMNYPHTFAAAVPICGGAGVKFVAAERIKHIPVWIFHGAEDDEVPVANSQRIYDALVEAGGHPKLTIYAGVKHDSWTRTYEDPDLWAWLFAQKRGGKD
jgi:predicted peptidase